jgi:hypothetical protein
MGDDDLDVLHVGHYRGMTTDVTGSIACDCAADRVPLPRGLVHATDRCRVEYCLGGVAHPSGGRRL